MILKSINYQWTKIWAFMELFIPFIGGLLRQIGLKHLADSPLLPTIVSPAPAQPITAYIFVKDLGMPSKKRSPFFLFFDKI